MFGTVRPDARFAQTRLWLAAYDTKPDWPRQIWPKYWAWQFTGDGNGPGPKQIPGIILPGSKGIDINSYDGTDDTLAAEWAA
jgi:GH25 family lysozyme M1 (1,4-beta-N-acetylmuramidase)